MLPPNHSLTLSRQRMVYAHPFRVWGRAISMNLAIVVLFLSLPWILKASFGGVGNEVFILWGVAFVWITLVAIGVPRLLFLQPVSGQNPEANRAAIREWAREQELALIADKPDYMLVLKPGKWYQGQLQVCFLLQGRDLRVAVAGVNRLGKCIALLSHFRATPLLRQASLAVGGKLVARPLE